MGLVGVRVQIIHRIHVYDWKKPYISESIEHRILKLVIMQKQYLKKVLRFSFG